MDLTQASQASVRGVICFLEFLPILVSGAEGTGRSDGDPYQEQLAGACQREIAYLEALPDGEVLELGFLLWSRGLLGELEAFASSFPDVEPEGDRSILDSMAGGGIADAAQEASIIKRQLNALLPDGLIPDRFETLIDSLLDVTT